VWTAGCERHCPGCANPELWEIKESQKISEDLLANLIKQMLLKHKVDGITITGGEPFLQSSALASCLTRIGPERPEVLIFSGFQMDELRCDSEKRTLLLLKNNKEFYKFYILCLSITNVFSN
jgi:anaerobic ribonucleoside-triphosphate reductase activating protein